MKKLLLVLAAAGLSGCAVYPVSSYDGYATGSPYVAPYAVPYVVTPPLYLQGGIVYRHDVYPRVHPGQGSRPRDRDRDGAPNRADRWPNDPRRR